MQKEKRRVAAQSFGAGLVIVAACGGAGSEGIDALRDRGESIDAHAETDALDGALADAGADDASPRTDASAAGDAHGQVLDGGDAAAVTDAADASADAPVDGDAATDAGADAAADAGALAWFYSTPLTLSNESSSGLYGFEWNANTASLTEIDMDPSTPGTQGVIGGAGMFSIAATPSGKFLYTANVTDSTIGAYAVEAATGWLSRIDANPAAGIQDQASAATGPIFVAVHPTADVLYVALDYAGAIETLAIDPTTGALTHASTIAVGSAPAAIALDPFGRYLAVANSAGDSVTLCRLDASGLPTAIDADAAVNGRQDFATGAAPSALTFDRSGSHLHVAHANGVASYLVNALTVSLSSVPGATLPSGLRYGASAHPTGDFLYVATYGANLLQPFSIASGTPVALSGGVSVQAVRGLGFEPAGRFLFATSDDKRISAFGIDPLTGALTSRKDIATWRAADSNTFAFVRR